MRCMSWLSWPLLVSIVLQLLATLLWLERVGRVPLHPFFPNVSERTWQTIILSIFVVSWLLLSLGKQLERRGRKAQKVILREPFSIPPTPFAHSSALSRCSCGSHRSARLPLGSENTLRPSVSALPCGCLAPPGCCQMAR